MSVHILIIEDEDFDAVLAQRTLRRAGIEARFDRAVNGDEVRERLANHTYDVVLCDVSIPGHSPDLAIDMLRVRERYTPLIVMSGSVRLAEAVTYLRAGAEDFVAKDELERLVPAVQRALREAALRAEHEEAQRSLRESRARLEIKQRLEAVGLLAGGIAHDVNNLLTAIIQFAELGVESLGAEHPVAVELREIRDAAWRAAALPRQLLIFTRREHLEARPFRLNALIAGMDRLLATVAQHRNEVVLDLRARFDTIEGDQAQVEQVVVNLVSNARDAMPGGGRVTLSTRNQDDWVVLEVEDTGQGIDPALRERIFEPFFTTKEPGKGTGLGLSTCAAVVSAMNGEMTLESEVGVGTRIRISLPRSAQRSTDMPILQTSLPRGHEHVLVVVSEPELRRSIGRMLEHQGYPTTQVGRRAEAEALLGALSYPLIIADSALADGLGEELLTGRGGLLLAPSPQRAPDGIEVLVKPFNAADLLSAVRRRVSSA